METEAKYVVPDEVTMARLKKARAFGKYVPRDSGVKTYHDRYVDTPDRAFYAGKFYARLRESPSGGASLITIKSLSAPSENAIHNREEYQTEVPGLDMSSWPEGEPRALAEELSHGQPLVDLLSIDQVRTVSTLYDAERAVAELSLDEITMQTQGEPVRAYELEVELRPDGTLEDLESIGDLLVRKYRLIPQPLSKFERAMMLTQESPSEAQPQRHSSSPNGDSDSPEEPPMPKGAAGVLADDSMQDAGRKIVGVYFRDMVANEEGTLEGSDTEALHDMRVATRRMRAAFGVLGPYLTDKPAAKAQPGLKAVTRALGEVRDLDVLLENARTFRAQLPPDEQQDMDGLVSELDERRNQARRKLTSLIKSKNYAQFKRRMESFIGETDKAIPDHDGEIEPFQVRHIAGSAIWERYEAVRAYETVMGAPTLDQLHALRVRAKYLRYTLECFRDTLPKPAGGLIRDIVKVQDHLGALHDAAVAADLVRSYQADSAPKRKQEKDKATGDSQDSRTGPGLARYLADREGAVERLRSGFGGIWANVGSAAWRATLARTVAGL